MINEQELKLAVECADNVLGCFSDDMQGEDMNAIKALMNLAEQVLQVQGKLPEKEKDYEATMRAEASFNKGYNEAIDACVLAIAKGYVSIEEHKVAMANLELDAWQRGREAKEKQIIEEGYISKAEHEKVVAELGELKKSRPKWEYIDENYISLEELKRRCEGIEDIIRVLAEADIEEDEPRGYITAWVENTKQIAQALTQHILGSEK